MKILTETHRTIVDGIVVEHGLGFTLSELSQASCSSEQQLLALVDEGVLEPQGRSPADWVFDASSLRTARNALRLVDELALNPAGAALVLDLLAQIEHLHARLRLAGAA